MASEEEHGIPEVEEADIEDMNLHFGLLSVSVLLIPTLYRR